MPDVQLPDGSSVSFPDGMDPAAMNAAISQFWSQRQAATSGRTAPEQASDKTYGKQGTASDVAMSALDAPVKALINLVGLPGALAALNAHAKAKNQEMLNSALPLSPEMQQTMKDVGTPPNASDIRAGVEKAIGQPLYEPQTETGRIAGRVAEGASIPGARLAGAVSGVTGEAGRLIAGKPGDIIGSLAGAGLTGLSQALIGTPQRVLRNALENVTDNQLKQADALLKDSYARGTPITGAEAIAQVTGGNVRLQDLQRVLERTSGGGGAFEPTMQARPGANATAMKAELGNVAPPVTQPSEIAPKVQAAAEQTVNATRQNINQTAQPFYQAAEKDVVDPGLFSSLQNNAMFQAALKRVRSDPAFANLKGLPDNAIPVVDAVKKQLAETADSFAPNIAQAGSKTREAAYTGAKEATEGAARLSSPNYNIAQGIQSDMRGQFLDPLRRSITGQLAAAEKFPQQASILFNPKPLEGSENEVSAAVKSIVAKDPDAARQLVRAYLKQQFDELTQGLSSGPNQFGGAGFAAQVAGNVQQAKNLAAALKALPNGDEIAGSFGRLLQIFQAQGMRARAGSATAFNAEVQQSLARGGKVAEVLETGVSPGTWLRLGKELGQRILYERNSAKLADILTSPDSVQQMRQIAKIDPQSAAGKALYRFLVPPAASQPQQ